MNIRPIFQCSDGRSLQVDTDLWLCALDLALVNGWKPRGTLSPEGTTSEIGDPFAYYRTDGRRIESQDASALATALVAGLRGVPDSVVPLQGKSFGEEHTMKLLSQAAAGEAIDAEMGAAATELLSGSPKSEAMELVGFLRGGDVSIGSVPRSDAPKRARARGQSG